MSVFFRRYSLTRICSDVIFGVLTLLVSLHVHRTCKIPLQQFPKVSQNDTVRRNYSRRLQAQTFLYPADPWAWAMADRWLSH